MKTLNPNRNDLKKIAATRVPELLYQSEYSFVGLIDLNHHTISRCRLDAKSGEDFLTSTDSYERICELMKRLHISPADYDYFDSHNPLTKVKHALDTQGDYSYTLHHVKNNKELIVRYNFVYFDKEQQLVLSTIQDISYLAYQDFLTGDLNRIGFYHIVSNIIKNNPHNDKFSLLFIDFKEFKALNEILGFEGGDAFLHHFHNELRNCFLHPIAAARLTSDHFVCLIERKYLDYEQLTKLLKQSFTYHDKNILIFAKCGIYHIHDRHVSVNGMCDRAHLACQHIENEYLQPYAIYDLKMKEIYMAQSQIRRNIGQALENNELQVYYQPIFSAATDKIVGAEALIRWIHPEKGMISPDVFIPTLEKNGHISVLDKFVSDMISLFLHQRHDTGKKVVPISMNISRMDFYDPDMLSALVDEFSNDEFLCSHKMLELTESAYISINNLDLHPLRKIQNQNVRILLDDFGSGFSSFSTITDYDFNILKLDMEFVRSIGKNPKIEAVLHTIISMAHELGIKVIAEGAETDEQVNFLKSVNCDFIQGYYYSKPVPQDVFETMLDEL